MKIFSNKNLIQKIIIAFVCVFLFNFCVAPTQVHAGIGGTLFAPVRTLVTFLADVVVMLVQFCFTGEMTYPVDDPGTGVATGGDTDYWKSDIQYPVIKISPELIFANQVQMLSIDFLGIDEPEGGYVLPSSGNGMSELRNVIAGWYVALRTLSIVGLLSVLVYVGIRIIISSTSQDKAKYKQRLMDWIVAFCLLFFLHYIMAGAINIVNEINKLLGNQIETGIKLNPDYGNVTHVESSEDKANRVSNSVSNEVANLLKTEGGYDLRDGYQNKIVKDDHPGWIFYEFYAEVDGVEREICELIYSAEIKSWYVTKRLNSGLTDDFVSRLTDAANSSASNETSSSSSGEDSDVDLTDGSTIKYFINYARLYLNVSWDDDYVGEACGFLIIYIVLVVFIVMFTIRYMKRVIYIAFLTLMAPLVALTYPIDKIKDR